MDDALPDFFDQADKAEATNKPAKNGRRKKRTPRPQPDQSVAEAADKPAKNGRRKKRGPKPGAKRKERKPRAPKIDLTAALDALAGLTEDDAKIVSRIAAGLLQQLPKRSRGRVVAALARLFA